MLPEDVPMLQKEIIDECRKQVWVHVWVARQEHFQIVARHNARNARLLIIIGVKVNV